MWWRQCAVRAIRAVSQAQIRRSLLTDANLNQGTLKRVLIDAIKVCTMQHSLTEGAWSLDDTCLHASMPDES